MVKRDYTIEVGDSVKPTWCNIRYRVLEVEGKQVRITEEEYKDSPGVYGFWVGADGLEHTGRWYGENWIERR